MFARCCAAVLIVLAASPFTAPFCTIDMNQIFGGDTSAAALAIGSDSLDKHAPAEETVAAVDGVGAHVRPVRRALMNPQQDETILPGSVQPIRSALRPPITRSATALAQASHPSLALRI